MTSATSAANNQYAGSAATAKDKIAPQAPASEERDLFTKLLVAQIRNQDPLSPQDPTQFVNQLSQLSQTEALQNLSQLTSANASVLASLQTLAMGGQVGSDVTVVTDTVKIDGSTLKGSVNLNGVSSATDLVLTGSDGRETRISLGAHGAGPQSFTIDPNALGLSAGTYQIVAKPADGSAPAVELSARLNGVRVTSTGVVLQVANIGDVDPAYVIGFNGKPGA